MNLALNYSPAAAQLVQAGQIDIDYFKTPEWDWLIEQAAQLRQVAVHSTLDAGNDSLAEVNWDKLERQLLATQTPYVNLHLDARQSCYPQFATDTADPSEVTVVTQTILSDIQQAVARFGHERVIIENSPYQGQPGNTMRLCVLPDFICHVIEETNCGLLLDISHAIITARHLEIDPADYMTRLPVDRIKELHFAGVHKNPLTGQLTDHLSIQVEDWPWLDWVLGHIQSGEWSSPWLLAFEYGGVGEIFAWRSDPHVIAEQVPVIYQRLSPLKDKTSS